MPVWNYRVVRRLFPDGYIYEIHEVHYDDDGNIIGWTADASVPQGEDPTELMKDVKFMLDATHKPYLKWEELPQDD